MLRNAKGLNACTLRLMAMTLMLLDHLYYIGILQSIWWNCLGRLAFPIFSFQIVEGYFHTRHVGHYCIRLLLFAILSEIPFDLMTSHTLMAANHQNVLFTLLLGLICIRSMDLCRQSDRLSDRLKNFIVVILCLLGSVFLKSDYGILGVMTVVLFYTLQNDSKIWQLIAMVWLHGILFRGGSVVIPLMKLPLSLPIQSFAVFSLIPIWLYNGEKGPSGKGLHWFCYCFYPLHMLLFAFL